MNNIKFYGLSQTNDFFFFYIKKAHLNPEYRDLKAKKAPSAQATWTRARIPPQETFAGNQDKLGRSQPGVFPTRRPPPFSLLMSKEKPQFQKSAILYTSYELGQKRFSGIDRSVSRARLCLLPLHQPQPAASSILPEASDSLLPRLRDPRIILRC